MVKENLTPPSGLWIAHPSARGLFAMKLKNSLFVLASLLFVVAQTPTSRAALVSPNIGGLVGPTFGSSLTFFTFGAEGQAQLMGPWGAGASLTYYTKSIAGYNQGFLTLTGQGLYFFSDILHGLRAGAQAGLGMTSYDAPGVSGTTSFIFGPTGGYDYKLTPNFSVGGEGTLYFSTQSGSSALFQLLAVLKYWF
jgi:hypothetical protein